MLFSSQQIFFTADSKIHSYEEYQGLSTIETTKRFLPSGVLGCKPQIDQRTDSITILTIHDSGRMFHSRKALVHILAFQDMRFFAMLRSGVHHTFRNTDSPINNILGLWIPGNVSMRKH